MLVYKKYLGLFDRSDATPAAGLLLMMVGNAFLEALGIGLVVPVLAAVSKPKLLSDFALYQWLTERFGTPSTSDLLIASSLVLLSAYAIKNTYFIIHKYALFKFIFSRQVKTSRRLMRSYMFKPYTFHLQKNSSELLRTVNDEVRLVFQNGMLAVANILVEGIIILAVLSMLLYAEPLGALATFAFFGTISFVFLGFIRQRARALGAMQQRHGREMVKWVQQGLGGIKESKVLNRELFFIDAYTESSHGFAEAVRKLKVIRSIPRPLIETLGVGGMMMLTALMLYQGRSVGDILPILGLFAMSAVRLLPSVNRIVTSVTIIRGNLPMLDSVLEGLEAIEADEAEEQRRAIEDDSPLAFTDRLAIEDLTFRYAPDAEQVIAGMSFELERGEMIGFVGASGAGKSTLVNLLLGLLEPEGGALLVDGKRVDPTSASWQKMFGYIAQNTYLCDDTIRRNVAFGLEDNEIDDEAIWAALKLARLDDFIRTLPGQLDAMVGEKGTRLSGGQLQRIGIARALYHDPNVIIMDEATSNLDNITERQISDAIEALGGAKTIIIIAHRLTTIRNCDRIFFLREGQIEAEGDFEALLDRSEGFRAVVNAWKREDRDAS